MGFWLIIWEKRKKKGFIALCLGITWFIITTKIIIPYFSGAEAAAVRRYDFLGNSVLEIAQNLILKPNILLSHIFTIDNAFYLFLLVIPVIWGLSLQNLTPLIPENGKPATQPETPKENR